MLYVEVDLVLGKVKPLSPLPRPTRVEMKGVRECHSAGTYG